MAYTNSGLVTTTVLTKNHSGERKYPLTKITIHHMAGVMTARQCGEYFRDTDREVSSNYGIGYDGSIGLYVEECNRSWCSSNYDNDHRAITIEVSNSSTGGDWPISDKAYTSLINLCVDICQRNNIKSLIYTGTKDGNLTRHNMFANTNCPGKYLQDRFPQIAAEVNARLGVGTNSVPPLDLPSITPVSPEEAVVINPVQITSPMLETAKFNSLKISGRIDKNNTKVTASLYLSETQGTPTQQKELIVTDFTKPFSFTFTGLDPGITYFIQLSAKDSELDISIYSPKVAFITQQSYPKSVSNLMLRKVAIPDGQKKPSAEKRAFKLSFDTLSNTKANWGHWVNNPHGYRISLVLNGAISEHLDFLAEDLPSEFIFASGNINSPFKKQFYYGDVIQVGVQTWITDSAGTKVFDTDPPFCTNSFNLIDDSYVSQKRLYLKTAEGLKHISLYSTKIKT